MIIDLTSPKMEAALVSNEEQETWNGFEDEEFRAAGDWFDVDDISYREARDDWVDFRDARMGEDRIKVVKEALLSERMRDALKRCSCLAIRPDVVRIIDNLDPVKGTVGTPSCIEYLHSIEVVATRIVNLDSQERSRRKAEHD